jgi:hypothetical protein
MLRRRREPEPPPDPLAHVDPWAVSPRFSGAVQGALEARRRYADIVRRTRPGPVQERLAGLGARVDDGVSAVWATATRASDIEATLAGLEPERVTDQYKDAKRSGADPELVEALSARFTSVQRLLNTLDDTDERLRLLNTHLAATVARAAEVALSASADGADAVSDELDGVVGDLTALRSALDELG